MEYNLKLPQNKRNKFAEPLDLLIAGKREVTLLKVEKIFRDLSKESISINFYIVGDIVTKDFLAHQFLNSFIKICIIDEKTQRKHIDIGSKGFFEEIIEFENPNGTIHKEWWSLLRKAINSQKKTKMKVTEGEEDLLVLPLIMELPIEKNVKNFVFYGQPPITDASVNIPEGIVIVEVNEDIKKKVKELIALMDKF